MLNLIKSLIDPIKNVNDSEVKAEERVNGTFEFETVGTSHMFTQRAWIGVVFQVYIT